jgi:hypothetical protein
MQKILELNEKHFMTGIARGSQIESGGLFQFCNQITPFFDLAVKGDNAGVLQVIEDATDITGAIVVDTPKSFAMNISSASAAKGYFLGSSGNFYQTDESGDNNPTNLRSGANVIANVAIGLAVYKGKCLYAQTTQIGEWDMSGTYPTGWTDNKYTGLQNHTNHYLHEFNEYLWVADKDRISKIDGTSIFTNVLDFPSHYRVHHITNDGLYLVITTSTNLGLITASGPVKIIWWNMFDDSWNWEVEIPDNYAVGCIPTNGGVLVVGGKGLYEVQFGVTGYRKVLSLASADAGLYDQPYTVGLFNGVPAWLSNNGGLYTYGQMMPGQPKILLNPMSTAYSGIFANYKTGRVYFATTNSLFRWIFTATATASSNDARTVFLNLHKKWNIKKIKVSFSAYLATNDNLLLTLYKDIGTYSVWNAITYSIYGAVNEVSIYGEFVEANLLALNIRFVAGNPRIRRIEIYGDPAPDN